MLNAKINVMHGHKMGFFRGDFHVDAAGQMGKVRGDAHQQSSHAGHSSFAASTRKQLPLLSLLGNHSFGMFYFFCCSPTFCTGLIIQVSPNAASPHG